MPTPHIESKKGEIAKIVLMPGDPNRAKYIAENYLEDYVLVNEVRGEDAYTGYYKGKKVTIFSSGMGIPSMAIYSYELFTEYNVDVIIRIGSCGSYTEDLKIRDIVLATSSYSTSNYDKEYTKKEIKEVTSNEEVNNIITKTAKEENIELKTAKVHTTEAFYNEINIEKYKSLGCKAVEMEAFSLFLNAQKLNKKASCILTVSDSLITKEEMTSEEREQTLNKMIYLALESILNV